MNVGIGKGSCQLYSSLGLQRRQRYRPRFVSTLVTRHRNGSFVAGLAPPSEARTVTSYTLFVPSSAGPS